MSKQKNLALFEIIGFITVVVGIGLLLLFGVTDHFNYGYIDGQHVKCTEWSKDTNFGLSKSCSDWDQINTIRLHWKGEQKLREMSKS